MVTNQSKTGGLLGDTLISFIATDTFNTIVDGRPIKDYRFDDALNLIWTNQTKN